jgi:uncharacterized membrane protein
MDYPSFWKNASLRRKRIYSIMFMFVIAVSLTVIGSLVPLSPQFAKEINDSINQTRTQGLENGTLTPSILLNNFGLCLAMFIPLVGAFLGLFIMFNTGLAFSAEFQVQSATVTSTPPLNISPTTAVIALLVFGLVFLLEYVSYSIGMAESIWLFQRLRQRKWGELKNAAILIGIVAVLLIVGAVVETWLISTIG